MQGVDRHKTSLQYGYLVEVCIIPLCCDHYSPVVFRLKRAELRTYFEKLINVDLCGNVLEIFMHYTGVFSGLTGKVLDLT